MFWGNMESMATPQFALAAEIGRVPSMRVPLDASQELRFQRLMEDLVLIDVHQHPMVLADDANEMPAYFRGNVYRWGFDAVKAGGWTAVATANLLSCLGKEPDPSFSRFGDLVDEVGMMLADVYKRCDSVLKVSCTEDILDARQSGKTGFMPTLEHLSIGHELHRVDVLYGIGIRLAGLTYMRKSQIGDGQYERTNCGLSDFGVEVVRRMNDIGMAIDLSHAGSQTALETIALSEVPVVFSHNAAYSVWPARRARSDEELTACAARGGLCCVTAVPNSLSDDPRQDINCVLDHYDYFVKLVGVEHVGIGTDTQVGDHVGFHRVLLGRNAPDRLPAPYLDGLESPADGSNIIRGLIGRGYDDSAIRRIAGLKPLDFYRRTIG
jgi:membrane dipeptidase